MSINEQFISAVKDGKPVSVLKDLLNKGANIDYKCNEHGKNAMFYFKTEEIAWYLYSKNININAKCDKEDINAFEYYISKNDVFRVRILSNMGAKAVSYNKKINITIDAHPDIIKLFKMSGYAQAGYLELIAKDIKENDVLFSCLVETFADVALWDHKHDEVLSDILSTESFNMNSVKAFIPYAGKKELRKAMLRAIKYKNVELVNAIINADLLYDTKPDTILPPFKNVDPREILDILFDRGFSLPCSKRHNPIDIMLDIIEKNIEIPYDCLDILVKHGLDINYVHDNDENILFYTTDKDFLREAIKLGVNINQQEDDNHVTPLRYYIEKDPDNIDFISFLVDMGADVLMKSKKGAYHIEMTWKHPALTKILVESKTFDISKLQDGAVLRKRCSQEFAEIIISKGIDVDNLVNTTDLSKYKKRVILEMYRAVSNNETKMKMKWRIEKMLDSYLNPYKYKSSIVEYIIDIVKDGFSIYYLIKTISINNIGLVKFFFDNGGDLKEQHETSLFLYTKSTEMMLLLIENNIEIDDAELFIHASNFKGSLPVLKIFLEKHPEYKKESSVLFNVLKNRQFDSLKFLLENGFDVNYVDANKSLFTEALRFGYSNVYDILLNTDYDINIPGALTVYMNSKKYDDECTSILSSIDKAAIEREFVTILTRARSVDDISFILQYFGTKRFSKFINKVNDDGNTVIFDIVKNCNRELLDFMISKGASLNHINPKTNETILFTAALYCDDDMFTYLADKVTRRVLFQENKRKETVLFLVIRNRRMSLYSYLIDKEVDPFAKSIYKESVCDILKNIDYNKYIRLCHSKLIKTEDDKHYTFGLDFDDIEKLLDKNIIPSSIQLLVDTRTITPTINSITDTIKYIFRSKSLKIFQTVIEYFPEHKDLLLDMFNKNPCIIHAGVPYHKEESSREMAELYIESKDKYIKEQVKRSVSYLFKLHGDAFKLALSSIGFSHAIPSKTVYADVSDLDDNSAKKIFTSYEDRVKFIDKKYIIEEKPGNINEVMNFFDVDKEQDIDCAICLCPLSGLFLSTKCCPKATMIHKGCKRNDLDKCLICRERAYYT